MLLSATVFVIESFAQQHLIEVHRFPNWGKEYLTITDDRSYGKAVGKNYLIEGTYGVVFLDKSTNQEALWMCGALITEIDGQTAKGMSEDEFYRITDNRDEFQITAWRKCDEDPMQIIVKKAPMPEIFEKYGLSYSNISDILANGEKDSQYDELLENRSKQIFSEILDNDFDWFYVSKYDFIITGDDPLTDKKILEKLVSSCLPSYYKRDTDNPDILLTVSKSANESISSTYIPPTSRTVNLGSTTTARYNYWTKSNEYITKQNNYTIREGGFTQTTNDTDIFLELSILDAKKIDDPKQTTAPIVWQMTAKRHVLNPNFNIVDEYLGYTTWAAKCSFKYTHKMVNIIMAYDVDVKLDHNNRVIYVKSGSSADSKGLKVGDEIIKYKWEPSRYDAKRDYWHIGRKAWYSGSPSTNNLYKTSYYFYACKIRRDGKIRTLSNFGLNRPKQKIVFFSWRKNLPE